VSRAILAEASAFDDQALAALASAGLIRRAGKLADATSVTSDGDETVVVAVGDETVTFTAGSGLANGVCSCPTLDACQHLVAAIVHLRSSAGTDGAVTETAESEAGGAEPVHDWLVELDATKLRRFSGKPALRWALGRLEDLDAEAFRIEEGPPTVVQFFAGTTVRFMAPTLASAFCDPSGKDDPRHIALAVLAVQAQAGREAPALPEPTAGAATPVTGRREVVRATLDAVADALEIGIAHLSPAMAERFDAISIGARGAKLHRLGLLSARVFRHIDDLIERRATADAAVLLADLALLGTLAEAVDDRLDRGDAVPAWIAGTARTEYQPAGTLDLLALGAHPWRTASGYAGVTGVFYDPTHQRFLELGGGRPNGPADPRPIYGDLLDWTGSVSLASMRGRRITVSGALVNDHGRLSGSSRTSAAVGDPWSVDDLVPGEWDGTLPTASSRLRGGRDSAWVCLRLQGHDPPRFDEVAQRLTWMVEARDHPVAVVVPWSAVNASTIEGVEALAGRTPTHVIGRLRPAEGGLTLSPVSAIVKDRLHVLAFDEPERKRRRRRQGGIGIAPPSPVNRSLERVAGRLLQVAERGIDDRATPLLTQIGDQAARHGFPLVGRVLTDELAPPTTRLRRAAHAIEECRSLA
jgi:hypothetical protein